MGEQSQYQKLLQQSSEERKEQDIQFEVKKAALQLEADILATQKSLAEAEQNRADSIVRTPFNPEDVINDDIEIEGLRDGLKRLQNLKTELF